jgi:hypothetical protein
LTSEFVGVRVQGDFRTGVPLTATDNEGLEYFKTQSKLTPRQIRWADYLSRFNYDVTHVEGAMNIVADALSRYYTDFSETDKVSEHQYVNVDVRIDPDCETLPADRTTEVQEARQIAAIRRSDRLQDKRVPREVEADDISEASATKAPVVDESDVGVLDSHTGGKSFREIVENDHEIIPLIKKGYEGDKTFSKVLEQPRAHP